MFFLLRVLRIGHLPHAGNRRSCKQVTEQQKIVFFVQSAGVTPLLVHSQSIVPRSLPLFSIHCEDRYTNGILVDDAAAFNQEVTAGYRPETIVVKPSTSCAALIDTRRFFIFPCRKIGMPRSVRLVDIWDQNE